MKQFVLALALFSVPSLAQETIIQDRAQGPIKVELQSVPTGTLVTLLMRDVMRVPYVIAPDVLRDRSPISVNLVIPRDDVPLSVVRHLRSMGLTVELTGGTVYVSRSPLSRASQVGESILGGVPQGAPLAPSAAPSPSSIEPSSEEFAVAIVTPAYRSASAIGSIVREIFSGLTVVQRNVVEASGSEVANEVSPDRIVLSGPPSLIDRAIDVIRSLDRPKSTVAVNAVVFEFFDTSRKQSALSVLGSILGGNVEIGANAQAQPGDNFLRVRVGSLSAIASALKADERFQVIAEPSLVARSGTRAILQSGSEVPTIGAIQFTEEGTPVRSVVYRNSGVNLTVEPIVRPGEIELTIQSERSSFASTRNGVNDSPTLNKSSASARLSLSPGETVAFAGLDETSSTRSRSGLFAGLLAAKSSNERTSQLVVIVQADIVDRQIDAQTQVEIVGLEVGV